MLCDKLQVAEGQLELCQEQQAATGDAFSKAQDRITKLEKDHKWASRRIKILELDAEDQALWTTKQTTIASQKAANGKMKKELTTDRARVKELEFHNGVLVADLDGEDCRRKWLDSEDELQKLRNRARKSDEGRKCRKERQRRSMRR